MFRAVAAASPSTISSKSVQPATRAAIFWVDGVLEQG
jgi:hypothetical protein